MRLSICIAVLATMVLTGGAPAQDKTFRKDLKIHELDAAFNDVAEELDLQEFTIRKATCSADVQATCTYRISGNIGAIAVADKPEGPIKSMTLIFARDSEAMAFLAAIGIMASVIEPNTTKNGRGRIVRAMMEDIEGGDTETTTKKTRFKRMKGDMIGIWVIAEPR